MNNFLKKGISFIKENPTIIYSLLLIIFLPLALLGNNYFALSSFQNDQNGVVDVLIQQKAVEITSVIGIATEDFIGQPNLLQEKINEIKKMNSEIAELEILLPEKNGYEIISSFNENEIGQEKQGIDIDFLNFAQANQANGMAHLKQTPNGRFWEIAKVIQNSQGEKLAIARISFPLAASDQMVKQVSSQSYLFLAATIIVILLLIANHTRFFAYAILVNKLKEIDKMKNDFVSMASHELRTPLAGLKGYLQIFQDQHTDKIDEQGKKDLNIMGFLISRLNELINDILEVSRIQQNIIPFNIQPTDISSVIESSAKELLPLAEQKNLQLIYEKLTLPIVKVDKERVKQILVNFISNAIRYTNEGKVEISTKEENKHLLITVADTGMGISAEEQKNLFQKFYRIKNKETAEISGTGLGLWISAQLAQKMNASISVESIQGTGSHFTLKIPMK